MTSFMIFAIFGCHHRDPFGKRILYVISSFHRRVSCHLQDGLQSLIALLAFQLHSSTL